MTDNTTLAIILGAMFLMLTIGLGLSTWTDHELDMEAAKAGLQQCLVGQMPAQKVVWQKECINTK